MVLKRVRFHKSDVTQKESCRGRSMVEMLGALAVLAVISVVGVTGYRVAMHKYAADVLIGEMNDVSQHITLDLMKGNVDTLMLPSPYDKGKLQRTEYQLSYGCRGGLSVTAPCRNVSSYFVEISGIPYWACYEARPLLRHLKWTQTMYINETENGLCSKEHDNTVLSIFDISGFVAGGTGIITDPKDNDRSCSKPEDCGYTSDTGMRQSCVNGQCVACVKNDDCLLQFVCNKETGTCENPANKCSSDDQCKQKNPKIPYCSSNKTCVSCYTDEQCGNGETCHTESGGCFSNTIKTGFCLSSGKKTIKANETYIYFGGVAGSWWDAKRWCAGENYRLVSLKDLGCVQTDTGVCLDANGNIPTQLETIKPKIGSGTTCVTDRKTGCLNYVVDLSNGQITTNARTSGCHALCRP